MANVKESEKMLSDLLNACTKDELHIIRRTLNVANASQLNKKDLVQHLTSYIIDHVEVHLQKFDLNRYGVLKKVMEAPGRVLPIDELMGNEYYEPAYYQQYGFLFLMEDEVVMPYEIRERLLQVDKKRLKAILARNTEWVQLTQGLLFYYGTMEISKLKEKVEHYTGQSVDQFEFRQVISDLGRYDFSVQYSESGVSHFLVDDPQHIELEHRSRPDVDYHPFTKAELLRAADEDYIERHEGYRQFVSFLQKNWEMDGEEADLITADLVDQIKQGESPSALVSGLQEVLDFSSMDQLQVQNLLNVLMALMNKTRLWELKGYTPEELAKKEPKHLRPLPQHPIQDRQSVMSPISHKTSPSAVVYNFQTKSKVGRNDPCPCGSGRKFKKCCGS